MIIKDLDPFHSEDRFARAGRAAEEQMAFYLRRAFADDPQVLVLNGIRLQRQGDAAQMDHMVLHPFGVMLVESKSVTGKVRVNAHGEWSRYSGSHVRGMPSPLLQAERQTEFLQSYLAEARVLEKDFAFFVRIAISDNGIIERPKSLDLDQVCKADQVPSAIRTIIRARHVLQHPGSIMQRALSLLGMTGLDLTTEPLTSEDLLHLASFLVNEHRPLGTVPAAAVRVETVVRTDCSGLPHEPVESVCCSRCGSAGLSIEYGYSYYFRCRDCATNAAIRLSCGRCGGKERIRKAGDLYFRDCPACRTSLLFFRSDVAVSSR